MLAQKLIESSARGNLEEAKRLLNQKISANVKDSSGRTALMVAARGGHLDIIKLLIKHGAKIDINDKSGQTALYEAMMFGGLESVRALIQVGENDEITVPQRYTWSDRDIDYLDPVLGPNTNRSVINHQDENGNTALMDATHYGDLEITRLLLQVGADIDLKDVNGRTAYDLAKMDETGWLSFGRNYKTYDEIRELIIKYRDYREIIRKLEQINDLRTDVTYFFNIIPKDIYNLIRNRLKPDKP